MRSSWSIRHLVAVIAATTGAILLVAGCSPSADREHPIVPEMVQAPIAPTDAWAAALQKTPFPYLLSLPKPAPTVLDGTFTKVERREDQPVHCLRCPDYAPESGLWKLQFDKGVFRVFHQDTSWQSVGSFVLSKDRLTTGARDQLVLFNDPICPERIGIYEWELEAGQLVLKPIEDSCAIYLRAKNLGNLPWLSCQPPNIEAAVTDHWPKPPGCE